MDTKLTAVSFDELTSRSKHVVVLPPYEHSDMRPRMPKHPHCFDPKLAVVELEDCLVNQDGFVLTSDGLFVTDSGYTIRKEAAQQQFSSIRDRDLLPEVEEPVALIGGHNNFYHWHLNWLPRAKLIERALGCSNLKYLIHGNSAPFVEQSLVHWTGCTPGHVISMPSPIVRVRKLFLPTFFLNPVISPFALRTYSQPLSCTRDRPDRRVFVRRSNATVRRIVNEEDAVMALETLGFEGIYTEKLSYTEELSLFGSTSDIVGLYGAGLTNMLFCHPGFSVVEVVNDYFNKVYWSLALVLGCRSFMRAPPSEVVQNFTITNPAQRVKDNDVVVDVEALKRTVEQTLRP